MTAQQPISPPPDFSSISYRPPNGTKFNTPFIMAIAALVLSIMGGVVSALGIACAVAALVVRKKSHAPVKEHRAPRATLALSILAVVFGISMVFSSLQPASITVNVSTSNQEFSQSPITIVMDGTTDEGESVHEKLEVTPGMPLQLKDKEPGTYSFTVDTSSLDGENFSYKESGNGTVRIRKRARPPRQYRTDRLSVRRSPGYQGGCSRLEERIRQNTREYRRNDDRRRIRLKIGKH